MPRSFFDQACIGIQVIGIVAEPNFTCAVETKV